MINNNFRLSTNTKITDRLNGEESIGFPELEIVSINYVGALRDYIDMTSDYVDDSTSKGFQIFKPKSRKDPGKITINFDYVGAVQRELHLFSDSRMECDFKLKFPVAPNQSTVQILSFSAFITKISFEMTEGKITQSITMKLSGPVDVKDAAID